jgi:peptidoglycan/xylan/chitin deacetylase (PgdA/CDA1 family)
VTTQSPDLSRTYQWNYRPRLPQRSTGFMAWPGNARIAVMLILLHEWESVPRPVRPMPAGAHHTFDYLALGAREYGTRFGIRRLLDVLDRHGIRASIMCNGLLCELFPESVAEAVQRGHELGTHQWDQAVHPPMFKSMEEERESLTRATDALEKITRTKTLGYMSQGPRPTPNTLPLCAEAGFKWTCDYSDSDIPYVIDVDGKKLVSVGYVMPGHVDSDLIPLGVSRGFDQLVASFDAAYEESARHPMKFCYAVHSHLSGRPAMATLLDKFLSHVRKRSGVWFCRGIDMADFWLQQGD